MQNIISVSCALVLIICSVQDCLYRMIDILMPTGLLVIITICKFICWQTEIYEYMLSVTPGIVLILISVLGKDIIGFADGVIVCLIGVCEDMFTTIIITLFGFAIAWVVILYKLVIRRYRIKKITIPYVPCVTIAWFCISIKGWLQ